MLSVKNISQQMHQVFLMMKLYVEKGWDTYESFLEIWTENNISQIHKFSSFRTIIFGTCQTAFSCFLGYCHSSKNDVERKGGIFGLYLTYCTQFNQIPSPILLSPCEFCWVKDIAKEFPDCNSIFSDLVKNSAFCFVPQSMAIFTKHAESPSPVMIDEYTPINDAFKRLAPNEKARSEMDQNDQNDMNELDNIKQQYLTLLTEIQS